MNTLKSPPAGAAALTNHSKSFDGIPTRIKFSSEKKEEERGFFGNNDMNIRRISESDSYSSDNKNGDDNNNNNDNNNLSRHANSDLTEYRKNMRRGLSWDTGIKSPRTPRAKKYMPPKLSSFDYMLDSINNGNANANNNENNKASIMDEINIFLNKLAKKEISIHCDFDNVIIEQLLLFINKLSDNMKLYDNYIDKIKTVYTELETEYYNSIENLQVLETEDDILQQTLHEQQENWEIQVKSLSLRGAISMEDASELGVELNNNEATHAQQSQMDKHLKEIAQKEYKLEQLNKELADKKSKLAIMKHRISTISDLEKKNEELIREHSLQLEELHSELEKSNVEKVEQDSIITEQMELIKDLSEQVTSRETEIGILYEKLQKHSDDYKLLESQLNEKQSQFEKSKLHRQESTQRLLIRYQSLTPNASNNIHRYMSISNANSINSNYTNPHSLASMAHHNNNNNNNNHNNNNNLGLGALNEASYGSESSDEQQRMMEQVLQREQALKDKVTDLQKDKIKVLRQLQSLKSENDKLAAECIRLREFEREQIEKNKQREKDDINEKRNSMIDPAEEKIAEKKPLLENTDSNENDENDKNHKSKKRKHKKRKTRASIHDRKRLSSSSSIAGDRMNDVSNEYGALCVVFGQTWC